MKYIVTYFIVTMVWTPCPVTEPLRDEFGRTYSRGSRYFVTAEVQRECYRKDSTQIKKEFSSKKEADKFILRGNGVYDSSTVSENKDTKSGGLYAVVVGQPTGELTGFKLDSIPLTTTK